MKDTVINEKLNNIRHTSVAGINALHKRVIGIRQPVS